MRKSRSPGRNAGFTLLEMVVATSLASLVLIGMFSLMTNMVSAEIDNMRNGTVTSWSLAGVNSLSTDIAGASAISYPAAGAGQSSMIVCTNWSTVTGAAIQTGVSNQTIEYCWDTTDSSPYKNTLLHYVKTNSPAACPSAPLTCTQLGYGGGDRGADIIAVTGVYQDLASDPIFTQDSGSKNGLMVHFAVGNPTGGTGSLGSSWNGVTGSGSVGVKPTTAVSVPVNMEIVLED